MKKDTKWLLRQVDEQLHTKVALVYIWILLEQIGAQIMDDLSRDRETIIRAREKVSKYLLGVFVFLFFPFYKS